MQPKQSWILLDNNPILRKKCSDITLPLSHTDQEYIDKMVCYIDACVNDQYKQFSIRAGIAVAGPQVGLAKRVIYLNFEFNNIQYRYLLANPRIVARSVGISYIACGEGCLSVTTDHNGFVPRNKSIVVKAYDLLNNKDIEIKADGLLSICLQHEIDHLEGILYYDHINPTDPYYAKEDWIKI